MEVNANSLSKKTRHAALAALCRARGAHADGHCPSVSRSIAQCELTHLARTPVDVEKARAQHAAYVWCLGGIGMRHPSPSVEDALPDAVFVEDTAVVLDEAAVIARPAPLPGARSSLRGTGAGAPPEASPNRTAGHP